MAIKDYSERCREICSEELDKPSEEHHLAPPQDRRHYNFDALGRRYEVDWDGKAIRRRKFWKPEEVPEADWKMLVLHEVLDMAHLVMDRVPLLEAVVVGTHLDPVVLEQSKNIRCH